MSPRTRFGPTEEVRNLNALALASVRWFALLEMVSSRGQTDLAALPMPALFALYGAVHQEFRRRGIARSKNLVGDYAEHLAVRAFALAQAPKSEKNYDGTDGEGRRYQVKARWLSPTNPSRQLSGLPDLRSGPDPFEHLVGVIFSEDLEVFRAAMIPVWVVRSRLRRDGTGWRMYLVDSVWAEPGVVDVTPEMQAAALAAANEALASAEEGLVQGNEGPVGGR